MGFPKLVQVLDSPRLGFLAVYEDGCIAQYDHTQHLWRPFGATVDYESLFCRTTRLYDAPQNRFELAPDVAVDA